ncbi:MAG TPA: transketolase [Bryobacteraceae bacterium]|nr:transketolase [Bryobacteraceae bacterium]
MPTTTSHLLQDKATQLRIDSIEATSQAGSGHPTSCASAAEIMSALFFSVMRYDPQNPADPRNDVFILSKGHAAPILYAAWAEAGLFPRAELLKLRTFGSKLEGHPTPRLPFVPVATGSLGQGLAAAEGMALAAKLDGSSKRIYVLMGDGETAEGSVWEAAHSSAHYRLDNLCATVDINRLGQSDPTMDGYDIDAYRRRFEAFGWNAIAVDGHDLDALLAAYGAAGETRDRPTVVLARTIKGKGIPGEEDKNGFHGRPLPADQERKIVGDLRREIPANGESWQPHLPAAAAPAPAAKILPMLSPPYTPGSNPEATRKAFGEALAALGKANPAVVVLDGDVKNSTYTEDFKKIAPERFFEMYIAEQNIIGAAMGLAAARKIPFASTFAAFFTRAYDFLRMAAISGSNIKLVGTHAGISIGEDGPSQMGLEDLAMATAQPNYTVLYPSDAVSAWRAIELAASIKGPVYIRTSRPKTPVIYEPTEKFEIGQAKILRRGDRALVVAAGITLFEALKAADELKNICVVDLFSVQPVDRDTLRQCAESCGGRVITVEDHYLHGGIGDAVSEALDTKVHRLAVRAVPRSGKPEELIDGFGISARAIVTAIQRL